MNRNLDPEAESEDFRWEDWAPRQNGSKPTPWDRLMDLREGQGVGLGGGLDLEQSRAITWQAIYWLSDRFTEAVAFARREFSQEQPNHAALEALAQAWPQIKPSWWRGGCSDKVWLTKPPGDQLPRARLDRALIAAWHAKRLRAGGHATPIATACRIANYPEAGQPGGPVPDGTCDPFPGKQALIARVQDLADRFARPTE